MAEEKEEILNEPVLEGDPKGIDTSKDNSEVTPMTTPETPPTTSDIIPDFDLNDQYKLPRKEEDNLLIRQGSALASGVSKSLATPRAFTQGITPKVLSLYDDIDLAKAIPDENERKAYIDEYGSYMIKGLDPDQYSIVFEDDIQDYGKFLEKKYDKEMKKFLDDLDENQGFLSELGNTLAKTVGLTFNAVTGLIPLTYGLAKGLVTWDAQNIFNNEVFDAWESMDKYYNESFVVYGGSDYHSGNKGFGARFMANPMKSINADIAPAAAFVAGAVFTEIGAGAIAPFTGGTALAANTARLGAMGTRLFSSGAKNVAKGMKIIKGVDTVSDFQKAKQIASLTQKYRAGLGTATTMVRTAGYESSLIARDTYRSAEYKGKYNYIKSDASLNAQATILEGRGYSPEEIVKTLETEIPENIKERIAYQAEQAGELAWFTNIPLVGASNLIQFSRMFNNSYKLGRGLLKSGSINPLRGVTRDAAGKVIAKADAVGWGKKALGYSMVAAKGGLTEGFEEFAQGVIEEGYSDYYASAFTNESLQTSVGFLDAVGKASSKYWNSVEGQDSILIGGLMGMIGIPAPVKIDAKTGKSKLGFQWYGGAIEQISELKQKIKEDRFNAKTRNDQPLNQNTQENFKNLTRSITSQKEMDEALKAGDLFNFKNKEYENYHSFVSNRYNVGLGSTVLEDIDYMEKLPIEEFNRQYAFKGGEFTKETRRKNLEKLRSNTKNILKAHDHVNTVFNDINVSVDKLRKDYKGIQDPEQLLEGLKEQMTYLYSSSMNLKGRENELVKNLNELTKGTVDFSVLDKIISNPREAINKKVKDETKETYAFATDANEFYKETLKEIREKDPVNYDLHKEEIKSTLKDIIRLKERAARTAGIYATLATNSGQKRFLNLYASLIKARAEVIHEELAKKEKEGIDKASSSNRVNANSQREQSRTGENTAETEKVNKEINKINQNIVEELKNIDPDLDLSAGVNAFVEGLTPEFVLNALEKSPALFNQILQYLESVGKPLPGVYNVDQLREITATNPEAINQIVRGFKALLTEYNNVVEEEAPRLDYVNTEESNNQPAPNPE